MKLYKSLIKMKVDKYDRQIRLWGASGQRLLSNSRVALIGCTGAGIESLKNLVLPGIGQIDIWDDSEIQVQDLSSSFFYEHSSVGQKKAEQASRNLLEMNPDVKGTFYIKNMKQFLNDKEAIKKYNLIIFANNLLDEEIIEASKILWDLDIPGIFINIVGFFFHIRLQKQTHFVQSSNTSSKKYYLRLNNPFPELLDYSNKIDIFKLIEEIQGVENFDAKKQNLRILSNIPYSIVLTQIYHSLPEEKRNRNALKEQIMKYKEKIHQNYRDNFNEALSRIYDLFQTADNFMIDISLFDHPLTEKCNENSHLMILFLKAAGTYLKKHKCLPQPTILPDMHTSTANYIQLKNVYKSEHHRCVQEICSIINEEFPALKVDEGKISNYIDNLGNLEVVEMRPFSDEILNPETEILNWLGNEKNIFLALRAYSKYRSETNEIPKFSNAEKVIDITKELKEKFKINEFDADFIREICRAEGKTTINISSIAGALVGQEGIKLITNCFTPMNNGYLFDGAHGAGYQVKL